MASTLLHFDPGHGASGDMVLGALLDLGVPADVVNKAVAKVGVDAHVEAVEGLRHGVRGIKVRFVDKGGRPVDPLEMGATGKDVPPLIVRRVTGKTFAPLHAAASSGQAHDHSHGHGHTHGLHHPWEDISKRVRQSGLPTNVRDMAHAILLRLAKAESRVHGIPLEDVAFHEVATADSLGDMVGAAAAICHLGPERITCDAFGVCSGSGRMEHGVLQLPGPATGILLEGAPIVGLTGRMETVTPTGAAILTTVAHAFSPPPAMTLLAQGHGLGGKDPAERANMLRAWLGETGRKAARVPETSLMLLETNVDDATPQAMAHAVEQALEAGAVDAWLVPVVMKKGRPGWTLCVLCPVADASRLTRLVLQETTTLGVRVTPVERVVAQRRQVAVETKGGRVRVKVAELDGQELHATPEHDDVLKAARKSGVAAAVVAGWAMAAYAQPTAAKSGAKKRGKRP